MEKLEILNEFNIISIVVRLILSLVIGGLIGIDREKSTRSAGFRTYALVCLASTLVTLIGNYIYINIDKSIDISRLSAQVISGIGFLGAGAIITSANQKVRGLTTAAALWTCGCIGIAIGIGFYIGALITGLFTLILLKVLKVVDKRYREKFNFVDIYLELHNPKDITNIINFLGSIGVRVVSLNSTKAKAISSEIGLDITIKIDKHKSSDNIIYDLSKIENVNLVHKVYI